jgi:hypothetical protein
MRRLLTPSLALAGLLACGGKTVVDGTPSGDGGTATGSGTATGTVSTATGSGGAGGATTGSGGGGAEGECTLCSSGTLDEPAYVFNECTPPLEVGCPATLCTPGVTDCGDGYSCSDWGAGACCWCQAAVPACVFTGPAQGPLPEYLKIFQTSGPAYQDVELQIEGFPFYVGALYYLARVGGSGDLMQQGGTTCSFSVSVPGQPDGLVPVWVSQYGGNEPWVLAGFFEWYSGPYAQGCTQPGYPCSAETSACCESADVPMGCVGGRCRRL